MSNTATKLRLLVKKIEGTPGFTVKNYRVRNDGTGKAMQIHQTPSDQRFYENLLRDLSRYVGWTEDLYIEAKRKDRSQRMAKHDRATPMINFQEPTSSNGQAAEVAPPISDQEHILPDATGDWGFIPDAFLGILPSIEYIGANKAKEYYDSRLDADAEKAFGLRNRHSSSATITAYGEEMARGKWLPNPHGIQFATDDSGKEWLIDGQQRMAAVVYANEIYKESNGGQEMPPIAFWVYRNVPPSMFKVLDTGRKRTNSQILQMMGVPNYTVTATALRYVYLWFNSPAQNKWKRFPPLTNSQIESIYRDHPEIAKDTYRISHAASKSGLSRSAMVAAIYLIRHYANPEAEQRPTPVDGETPKLSPLEQFIEDFQTGASMPPGDPVLALREFSTSARMNATTRATRRDPTEGTEVTMVMFHMMLIIRAWNHRVRGTTVAKSGWKPGQIIQQPLRLRNT